METSAVRVEKGVQSQPAINKLTGLPFDGGVSTRIPALADVTPGVVNLGGSEAYQTSAVPLPSAPAVAMDVAPQPLPKSKDTSWLMLVGVAVVAWVLLRE
jgi:hypothetical protein